MELTLGLDIGSHTIKLIELAREGDRVGLMAAGSIPTPPKGMFSAVKADVDALSGAIKHLIRETGAKSKMVSIALPESRVFTRVVTVPALSERELSSAIKLEAEQYIPLPLDQVNVDYTVLSTPKRLRYRWRT